jgi:hypothetical protein
LETIFGILVLFLAVCLTYKSILSIETHGDKLHI